MTAIIKDGVTWRVTHNSWRNSVKIETTRFGNLEVNKADLITFKEGLLGFDHLKKFFIVDPGDKTLILWLQSTEEKSVAFPILEPKIFCPEFSVQLLPIELQSLDLTSINDASVYAILTIPKVVTEMNANLKAPVIINNKTRFARQIVLQDNKLDVKYPMYKELKLYISNYSSDDTKRTFSQPSAQTAPNSEAVVNKETPVSTNKRNTPQAEA